MTDTILTALCGAIIGATLAVNIPRIIRYMRCRHHRSDQNDQDTNPKDPGAWTITSEDVRKATSDLTAAAQTEPEPPYGHHPKYRIRYQPRLGSWVIYKWIPEHSYYYGYGITYPIEGRWVLQTRVPTWEDAINLITPNPAIERGSSH